MDKGLDDLTVEFDRISLQIKELESQKTRVRAQIIKEMNKRIHEEYPELDDPENQSYHYIHPETGLLYKKSVAEVGTKFRAEQLRTEHPRLSHLVSMKLDYILEEDRAEEWCRNNPEDYSLLQGYVIPGKKQTRIYMGVEPKAEDL